MVISGSMPCSRHSVNGIKLFPIPDLTQAVTIANDYGEGGAVESRGSRVKQIRERTKSLLATPSEQPPLSEPIGPALGVETARSS
jgi:hypothetical protein